MVDKNKFEEVNGYNISIVGRNIHATEAMKNYVLQKLSKLERFQNHIIDLHVTLDTHKLEHSCLIVMKFDHFKVTAHAVASDMYVAIDQAVDRSQIQLKRWKDKMKDLSKKKVAIGEMQVEILSRPNEISEYNQEMEIELTEERNHRMQPGKVIGNKALPLKMLTQNEAVMKMELSGDAFMVYKSEEDQKLKVIYRRDDGNYGIIRPE